MSIILDGTNGITSPAETTGVITATSIVGLTTPLSVAQGGTGNTTGNSSTVTTVTQANIAAAVAPSTSGNVLTSNGTAWTSAALNVSGTLINTQYFLSGTATYTPTAGTTFVIVEVLGGGGNGGNATSVVAGGQTNGGHGAGGGYACKKINSAFSGVTVTVGAATATSSFGALVSATGGPSGTTVSGNAIQGVSGTPGGIGISGDVNYKGMVGAGVSSTLSGYAGGSSPVSAGAERGASTSANGVSAPVNSGAGASGATSTNTAVTFTGGTGGSGIVIVWEYK
jgi:hypothetical protein